MMVVLTILFGALVGFALGLTGGGGGVFAVPLLVYGLGVAPREAVGISLAAVGGTALVGVVPRWVRREVEVGTGLLFSVSGVVGAPLGSYLSTLLPENLLLVMFACLMLIIAWQMWAKARNPKLATGVCITENEPSSDRSACQRDEDGTLRLTSQCARLLAILGLMTGILSGMFGVGGGFVIVPALVLFSGMEIHRAVGTSLFSVVLISISGVASFLASGRSLSLETTLLFMVGGVVGMGIGGQVAKRLKGPTLQMAFASAVVLVAIFMIARTVIL